MQLADLYRILRLDQAVEVRRLVFAQCLAQLEHGVARPWITQEREHHGRMQPYRAMIRGQKLGEQVGRRRVVAERADVTRNRIVHLELDALTFHAPFDGLRGPQRTLEKQRSRRDRVTLVRRWRIALEELDQERELRHVGLAVVDDTQLDLQVLFVLVFVFAATFAGALRQRQQAESPNRLLPQRRVRAHAAASLPQAHRVPAGRRHGRRIFGERCRRGAGRGARAWLRRLARFVTRRLVALGRPRLPPRRALVQDDHARGEQRAEQRRR